MELVTSLIGPHNLANCLLAGACALAIGVDPRAVARGWMATAGAPGRLEPVTRPGGAPLVLVDYAHTPQAVEQVLASLRPVVPGRIVTVVGCGGDRDAGKRPLMARAAQEGSDVVVLTSDNPRTEDPEAILDQMEDGLAPGTTVSRTVTPGVGFSCLRVTDRRAAIQAAVGAAGDGDLVLLAGKGHEPYQEIDGVRHPFDDRIEAAAALAAWVGDGTR